jgi:hypothetical protein
MILAPALALSTINRLRLPLHLHEGCSMTDTIESDEVQKRDVYLRLADRAQHRFDQRREYEWKVNFGLWTAIGLALGFLLSADAPIDSKMKWAATILLAIIVLVYGYWISMLHVRARRDRDTSIHWEDQAIASLPKPPKVYNTLAWRGVNQYWVFIGQIGFTFLLAAMLALSIWFRPSTATFPPDGRILIEGNGPSRIVVDPANRPS